MRRWSTTVCCLTLALLLGAGADAYAAQECHPHGGAVVLTIADSGRANRGAISPLDQFAGSDHQGFKFARAYSFTADDLAALPQQAITMVLPYDKQPHLFSGPALATVLRAAGVTQGGLVAHGIDGYRMEFSAEELARLHPILSLCRDGRMHGIGDLGPAFVVYAPAHGPMPSDDEFAKMIWGVYLIDGVTP